MIRILCLLSAIFFTSLPAQAEQLINVGDLEIHYSSFPSTFLTPEVANAYNIKRSRYSAVVNVAILDKSKDGKPAVQAVLSGKARNLLGTEKKLSFREIREGSAIYYIAELKHTNEERFKFIIDVTQNGTNGRINFDQTFFVD